MTTIEQPGAGTATLVQLPAALTDPAIPRLPDVLLRARAAVQEAAAQFLTVSEDALLKPWLFRGVDPEDGVRYGMYRGAETIELAEAGLEAALAGAPARAPGAIRCAPATIARWALHGRLAALDDAILDRVPRPGEWAIREVLAHIVDGQRGYGVFSRWWASQPLGEGRPTRVPDDANAALDRELPGEAADGAGSLTDIRTRLDEALDEWAGRFADVDEAVLAVPAVWSRVPLDIDFRLGRWASHIREHTVQIDKTLDWLGYTPSEPARIVLDLYATWGRLEARIFPVAPDGTESAVAAILERCSAQLVSNARSTREAAEA